MSHKHSSEFFISVSDTSLKDESRKDEIMNTVFRDLFRIRNFEICEITELFNSFSEERKMVMDFANALINTWKDK